jgi:hypothetical protein
MRERSNIQPLNPRLLSWRAWLLIASLPVLAAAPVRAQVRTTDPRHAMATREEIEEMAVQAEQIADNPASSDLLKQRKHAEAEMLRERLRDGDFQVGDRVVVGVRGDSALTDTFVVRAGQMLELPNIPPISLKGVLRSELNQQLFREIGRYLKNPDVTSGSLVRIAVEGAVTKPGYHAVPADMLVSDVIMTFAGGPTSTADLDDMEFKRGSEVVWNAPDMRIAVREGATLDQLNIRAGDELVIGEKAPRGSRLAVVQSVGVILGLVISIYSLTRLRR